MVKIHITGNSGSGKTTLAKELGRRLNLPVFGLDKIVWQSGWIKTPKSVRTAKEAALISQSEWIIEGVSTPIRQAADIVIFLDMSRALCFFRAFRRKTPFLFRSRPDLPDGCPEILMFKKHIEILWKFKNHTRPQILEDLRHHHGRVYIIRTRADIDMFWRDIGNTF